MAKHTANFHMYLEEVKILSLKVYGMSFLLSLFERAFKMMKNGVYFIVVTLFVAELFKIMIYAN